MKKVNSTKIGEIEIPSGYLTMSEDEKTSLCWGLFEMMLETINKKARPEYDRFMILDKLLESSIQTNEEQENYEICAVLRDIQKLMDA